MLNNRYRQAGGMRETVRPQGRPGLQAIGGVTVEPNRVVRRWIILNEWLKLDAVGPYVVTFRFLGTARTTLGETQLERVASYPFEVLPRDENALLRACAELLQGARHPYVYERMGFVRALSLISDPIVVPFLAQSAEINPSPSLEIESLARLGGTEARAALEGLAANGNLMTASMARQGLVRLDRASRPR